MSSEVPPGSEIDVLFEAEGEADPSLPKPHRVTVRLSDHDLKLIDEMCRRRGVDRSKAIRLFIRSLGRLLQRAPISNTRWEGGGEEVVLRLPREAKRITIVLE